MPTIYSEGYSAIWEMWANVYWAAPCDRPLERSACVACPFQSRQRWVETKRRWPEMFAEAAEIDANLRDSNRGLAFPKESYLHSPAAAPGRGDQPRRGAAWNRREARQLRKRVGGALWHPRGPEGRSRERHHPTGLVMTPTSSVSMSGSWLRLGWLLQRRLT